ncbi:MAG TPA: hybrid sensor histidine kinase/response regulator [Candidatus Polarisedimenticolaceae bacterium]
MSSQPSRSEAADLLVVDDDPRNRKLLEEYLVAAGHAVRLAPDGRSAIAAVRERVPDIVFLDVMMPDISGLEVCRMLKADPATRMVQIVLVTALDGTPHRVEGLDTGADDFISKPVRREEFLAKVRSLLRARRLMRELDRARADLALRNRALEEMEALKETLAQTLVHDLKNPLTAIAANLDLLERRIDDADARHLVMRCRAGASRMHRMILDLLDVAGLEEGKLLLRLEDADAVVVARRAIEDAEGAARQREIVLVLDAALPCPIRADASVLGRVFDNLLANAIDHSNRGGRVTVRLAPCEEGVSIDVADEGPGIPEEHRERVFEKFARLELRKAGLGGNRGLGLTFCRLAVEAHGGTIWVDAAPGGGALFRTILPAMEAPAAAAAGA